ncbi:MAG: ribonuclease [Clostridiales bacterium]|jgi:ribonuclease D|nr:ribonuclease [Clostridiales bacterium]MDN5281151.1 ribonuclease [Candidatus Ozemobacter sp.]
MKSEFDPKPFVEATQLIEDVDSLKAFFAEISATDVVAVDIESAGFYKYYSRVNLIQIATRKKCAIFDPQKIKDFSPFQKFCETSDCMWVFHGGDYDISMLARDLEVYIPQMFDTRKAAEFLGLKELGLRALTEKYLGFSLDKRLQRCDWSRRPLTSAMKEYGILDAICLIPIYDQMTKELNRMNRLKWVKEECHYIAQDARKPKEIQVDPFAFRIKGSTRLSLRSLAVLKEVWQLREKISEKIDRAPFMVLSNNALLDIARQMPRSISGLSVIKSVHREFLNRHASELQSAIKKGLDAPLEGLERPTKARNRQTILTAWEGELAKSLREIRDDMANDMGLAASLLAPTQAIYELAKLRPSSVGDLLQCEILHEWQVRLLADNFIPLLQQEPPQESRKKRRRRRRRPGS